MVNQTHLHKAYGLTLVATLRVVVYVCGITWVQKQCKIRKGQGNNKKNSDLNSAPLLAHKAHHPIMIKRRCLDFFPKI